MVRRIIAGALAAAVFAGCSARTVSVPSNVTFGPPAAMPAPAVAANDDAPRILAVRFSSEEVRRGQDWSGAVVASTNVASVEVRSSLFSINVPRRGFGRFAFTAHVLDLPPIFIRGYRLRVIARNSAGAESEEDLPFRIR